MRKLVLMAVAMALVAALPAAGAQAKTKAKQISTGIYLDVAGSIDRRGGVLYLWFGDLSAKQSACLDGRNVTLFRVEPNGTSTPVGSNTTSGSEFANLLEGPLDALTGYYYAEVAPKRVTTKQKKGQRVTVEPNGGRTTVIGGGGRARKLRLNCLAARTSTIYVEVPAGLLTSP
jgi:hypothetical protein